MKETTEAKINLLEGRLKNLENESIGHHEYKYHYRMLANVCVTEEKRCKKEIREIKAKIAALKRKKK